MDAATGRSLEVHHQMDQAGRALSPIDALHQSFAKRCAESFSTQSGTRFRAIPLPSTTLPYHDHLLSLANPTFLLVFTCNLFQGEVTVEIHPALAYLILEQLLGGTDAEPFIPKRKFTEIESRLLCPILNQLLEDLAKVWPDALPDAYSSRSVSATFTLLRVEHNPHSTHIVPDDEQVTILPIEFVLAAFTPQHSSSGLIPRLTLCLPSPAVAMLGVDPGSENNLFDRNASFEFRAVLAETTLTLEEVASLGVGDVITTERAVGSLVSLVPVDPGCGGKSLPLEGRLVKLRGRKAIQISRAR
jgi:flagellar motor switch protein FliM